MKFVGNIPGWIVRKIKEGGYTGAAAGGILSGLILSLCFIVKYAWPLSLIALVPLFVFLRFAKNRKVAALGGYCFGFSLCAVSTYWLGCLVPGLSLALALEKGIIPALAAVLLRELFKNSAGVRPVLMMMLGGAAVWTLSEYLQTFGPFGFFWGLLGLSLTPCPFFLQTGSIWGLWGLSFIIAATDVFMAEAAVQGFCGGGSAEQSCSSGAESAAEEAAASGFSFGALKGRNFKTAGASAAALWGVVAAAGFVCLGGFLPFGSLETGKPVKWGVLQLSIPQEKKFDEHSADDNLKMLLEACKELTDDGAEVILWPETSMPYRRFTDKPSKKRIVRNFIRSNPAWHLIGSLEMDHKTRQALNTISVWNTKGRITDRYHKFGLVPFGEYLPARPYWPKWFPGVDMVMEFKRGKGMHTVKAAGSKVGLLICFESMSDRLAREQVLDGAQILAVSTNDAWFKETIELPAHFGMSVMRAVEFRRPVVSSSNTGISGFVDHFGTVREKSGINDRFVKSLEVTPVSGLTVYARLGSMFWIGIFALIGGLAFFSVRRHDGETAGEKENQNDKTPESNS